jgi:putative nucleotidyltransferase with HDIG domain
MRTLKGITPEGIPTLPVFVQQLLVTLQEDFFTAQDLEKIISQDAAIAARILKIANSSLFGLSGMVGTLSHAIVILGTQFIKALALSVPVIDSIMYKKTGGLIPWSRYWSHSFACALACSRATRLREDLGIDEEAFVVGLLHDIGKPILWTYRSQEYQHLLEKVRGEGYDLRAAEQATFGIDHAELGGEVTSLWGFPEVVCVGIAGHHDREAEDPSACLAQVCDYVANFVGFSDGTRTEDALPSLSPEVLNLVGQDHIDALVRKVQGQSEEIQELIVLLGG